MRKADISRTTGETDINVSLDLDGIGKSEIATGVGFLNHMLDSLAGIRLTTASCRRY